MHGAVERRSTHGSDAARGRTFRSTDRTGCGHSLTACMDGRRLLLRSFLASSVHETQARTARHNRTCDCASCVVSRSHIGLTGRPSRFSVSP